MHRQKKRYIKWLGRYIKWLGGLGLAWVMLSACQAGDLGEAPSASTSAPVEARSALEGGDGEAVGEAGAELGAAESGLGLALPKVVGDRLWANLESLVGQRYWAQERAATRQIITASLVASGWQVQEQGFDQGINLVATYPLESGETRLSGTEPGETEQPQQILVGAHYDTVQGSPGADDNATGVAALLEIAALYDEQVRSGDLAQLENSTRTRQRGLVLVFFDQEENGLLGSLAFTAEPGNLASVHSAVVLDMLGASCGEPGCQRYPEFLDRLVAGQQLSDVGDFIAVVGEAERPGLLGAFGAGADSAPSGDASRDGLPDNLPDVLRVPVPLKGLLTPDVLRSDHAPFWLNGVGAVLVTDTANLRNPHYHQPSDDLGQVDRRFFEGVAQQVVNGVWRLLEAG